MALEILKKLNFIECWSTTEARIDPWGERVFHHPAGGGWKNPGQKTGGPSIMGLLIGWLCWVGCQVETVHSSSRSCRC